MARYKGRQFLTIDGEAQEGVYTLLADSSGAAIHNLDGLTSHQCLTFASRTLPRSASWTRVGYGLHYDLNMWVRDWPEEQRVKLFRGDVAVHDGWWLHYVANRILTIRRGQDTSVTIYDCLGMFRQPFVDVVRDWLGAVPEIVLEGKQRRERFTRFDTDFIAAYNAAECELLRLVLVAVDAFLGRLPGGGVRLRGWYGCGAIAANWLRRAGVRRLMRRFDGRHVGVDLLDAFARAYHGGRIESRVVGTVGPVWRYDLNSAYAWAASHMGRLTYRWIPCDGFIPSNDARMSVWLVEWNLPAGSPLGPFPVRDERGAITYPLAGLGWYWWPEVRAARDAYGSRRIRVSQGYVCEDGGKPVGIARPDGTVHGLGTVLRTMYQYRSVLRRDGEEAGARLLKLALAAVWGKFAQRASATSDDEPGYFYCLPWAGWITSCVRASILRAVTGYEDAVVAISTDGVVTTRELPHLAASENLGGWRVERFDRGTFVLPGLFRLLNDRGENVEKSRGFERTQFRWDELLDALNGMGDARVIVTRFIGHLLADLYPDKFGPLRCKFVRIPIRVNPAAVGQKRLGGGDLGAGFDWHSDHVVLGVHAGSRDFLSCPIPEDDDDLKSAVARAERDGDLDATI